MARTFPVRSRLSEIGRIRIGTSEERQRNGKTVKMPQRLDTFRLTSQDQAVITRAAQVYGGEVQPWKGAGGIMQWQVLTAANTLKVVVHGHANIKAFYEEWDGETCQLRCDGCTVLHSVVQDQIGKDCWCNDEEESPHKLVVRLPCTLPDVAPYGLWRLDSHGKNATADFLGVAHLRDADGLDGQAPFEAMLRLEQKRSGGRLVRVPVLHPVFTAPAPPPTPQAADDAARALYGDHVSTMAPSLPPPLEARERVDVADLTEAIEAVLVEGGTDPSRYWGALCAHWAIESPRHMAPSQLQEVLRKVQADLARKQQRAEAHGAPVGGSPEAQDETVP